jgi:hypothetical protein
MYYKFEIVETSYVKYSIRKIRELLVLENKFIIIN